MKFILSFIIITTALSADTCFKLSLGNAALTPATLCSPINSMTPLTPIKCEPVTPVIDTQNTIKCNLPTPVPAPAPIVTKCTPAPIECPTPVAPVIEPGGGGKCNPTPTPSTPSSTPEPASYALLGGGLVTAGLARRFRKKAE
jgi:hypothetical protein